MKIFTYLVAAGLCMAVQNTAIAQEYFLDQKFKRTTAQKAVFRGQGEQTPQGFKVVYQRLRFDRSSGTIYYKDTTLASRDGKFIEYYEKYKRFQSGQYVNDQREGLWHTEDSLKRTLDSTVYKNDRRLYSASYAYNKNGNRSYEYYYDSLHNTLRVNRYDSTAMLIKEISFTGNKGIKKKYANGILLSVDTLFEREEKEAEFPGGMPGWARFLQKNLDASVPVKRGAPGGVYTTVIRFTINPDGSLTDFAPETNMGYDMEQEVIRILKKGPDWVPASQFGDKIKAYRRQPVTFVVDDK